MPTPLWVVWKVVVAMVSFFGAVSLTESLGAPLDRDYWLYYSKMW